MKITLRSAISIEYIQDAILVTKESELNNYICIGYIKSILEVRPIKSMFNICSTEDSDDIECWREIDVDACIDPAYLDKTNHFICQGWISQNVVAKDEIPEGVINIIYIKCDHDD